jgi:hypothetical protein
MAKVWFSQGKNPVRGAETLFICFKEYFRPKRPSSTWKAVTMSSNLEGQTV